MCVFAAPTAAALSPGRWRRSGWPAGYTPMQHIVALQSLLLLNKQRRQQAGLPQTDVAP